MTGTLAASSGGGVTKIVQSIPLIVIYLATLGVYGFAIFKLNGSPWHKILAVFTFLIGLFFTVAIPKASIKMATLSALGYRPDVDIVMMLLLLVALIMTFVENKK